MYTNLAATFGPLVIRSLLHSGDVTAQLRGDILFTYPCTTISNYQFRPTNKCYTNIPISFELNNHTVNNAFLKTDNLREIVYNDSPVSCKTVRASYFRTTNKTYMKWNGESLESLDHDHLHVTTLSLAIAFSKSQEFHLNNDKIFDETTNTLDNMLDLNSLATQVQSLHTLVSAISSNTNLDVETAKSIASNLGAKTSDVLAMTASTLSSILPSSHAVYVVIVLCIILAAAILALFIFVHIRGTQVSVLAQPAIDRSPRSEQPSQAPSSAAASRSGDRAPTTKELILQFRALVDKK